MAARTRPKPSRITRISGAVQIALWVAVVIIAFFMQIVPFLLILTMFNLAVGIKSGTALVIVPAAAFGMLAVACWIATRRTRNLLPDPLPQRTYISPTGKNEAPLTVHQRLIPILQRWRQRGF